MRRILALLAALLVLPPLAPARASDPAVSDGTGPLDTPTDLDEALRFEALIPEHTFGGMIVALSYDAWPHLDPGAQALRMVGEGDSGNYTGVYLAAQSWRYAQAKRELEQLGADPLGTTTGSPAVEFWQAQRDEARARADEIVRYYHLLVNIAGQWQTELDPQVGDPAEYDQVGWLDFGGGLVPGEPGLLMRACSPADPADPVGDLRLNHGGHHNLFGPFRWEDGRDYYCLGGTSRDSYAGTIFGLAVALDFLATDENAELRTMLAADLMAMTDYAVKYLWFQPRPHGMISNPAFDGNDLEGPISPLFIQVPLHRMHLLQTARHAAEVVGNAEAKARYDLLWSEEVAASLPTGVLAGSMIPDSGAPHNAYYKYQLHLMSYFDVLRLEPDPAIRQEIARALGIMDATIADDGNAFFEVMTYALTGEQHRLDEAVVHHREWLDYYAFHEETARRGVTPFVHTGRCAITEDPGPDAPIEEQPLACVPHDQVDMVVTLPTGDEVVTPFQPGTEERLRSLEPLPVGVRRLADFLWQKDPTIIDGDHDTPWRGPSIDFLATYWMIRYYSEVEPPTAVTPLPAWAGPRWT
jgi:hypothetical protein